MILDTNALSSLAEGDERLRERLLGVQFPSVPVIVLGEYRFGIRASRHRTVYETWLETNLPDFEILSLTAETASAYAEVRRELKTLGRPVPENDLWICALARQHRLAVVTRDRHFALIPGLETVAW